MKKFFLGLGAFALIASSTSCGSKSSCDESCVINCDSLAIAMGASMGSGIAAQISSIPDSAYRAKLSKKSMLDGIEYVLSIDTANVGETAGLSIGLQLAAQIKQFENMGAKIDRDLVFAELKKHIMEDSASMTQINEYNNIINTLVGQLQAEMHRKQMEALENSPEAIQGKKTGEAFINKKKQEDPEIKTTESGLSYKIINEGEGEKAKASDYVKVKYVGKLINETIFDDSKGEAREFNVSGVVKGFGEGLQMLGKGGKATLYIPGNLAYGVHGQPAAGIGPNETLIFDIEVTEINAEKSPLQGITGKKVNK